MFDIGCSDDIYDGKETDNYLWDNVGWVKNVKASCALRNNK